MVQLIIAVASFVVGTAIFVSLIKGFHDSLMDDVHELERKQADRRG